jgi:hypothetical protein
MREQSWKTPRKLFSGWMRVIVISAPDLRRYSLNLADPSYGSYRSSGSFSGFVGLARCSISKVCRQVPFFYLAAHSTSDKIEFLIDLVDHLGMRVFKVLVYYYPQEPIKTPLRNFGEMAISKSTHHIQAFSHFHP